MSALTHKDLIELGQLLGYELPEGLCRGFSGMLMQAILAEEEAQFWHRLQLIEIYKDNFLSLVEEIEGAKSFAKQGEILTSREVNLMEILAFYEGIALYLEPYWQRAIFNNQPVFQENLENIYALVKSTKLETVTLVKALNKPYAFTTNSLTRYIRDLGKAIGNQPGIPIILDSSNHSILLKYQPQINADRPWLYTDVNNFGLDPMHSACYQELDDQALLESLYISFGDPHKPDFSKPLLFNTTVIARDTDLTPLETPLKILDSQYGINSELVTLYDVYQASLLYIACWQGNLAVVAIALKQKGIALNKQEENGVTPLFIACEKGHFALVLLLLKQKGIALNQADNSGATPLLIACQNGHLEIVRHLLAHEGMLSLNTPDSDGYTPLAVACQFGQLEIVRLLLAQPGIAINTPDRKHVTPLFFASQNGDHKIVKLLLKQKDIAVDSRNYNGLTPLYIACENGHLACINSLLKNNADPNALGLQKHTPLLLACVSPHTQGKSGLFSLLLKNGANIYHTNMEGQTAIDIAFLQNHQTALEELLFYAKKQNLPLQTIMSFQTSSALGLSPFKNPVNNRQTFFYNPCTCKNEHKRTLPWAEIILQPQKKRPKTDISFRDTLADENGEYFFNLGATSLNNPQSQETESDEPNFFSGYIQEDENMLSKC